MLKKKVKKKHDFLTGGLSAAYICSRSFLLISFLILSTLPLTAHAQCEVPGTDGLIAHWKLDDTSGTNLVESVGAHNFLFRGGCGGSCTVDSQAGIIDTGIYMESGVHGGEYADSGNALALQDNFTAAIWVKFDSIGARTDVFWKSHGSSPWLKWLIELEASGNINFQVANTSTSFTAEWTGTAVANTWYHIVGVKEGSSLKIYLNGVDATNTADTFTGTPLTGNGQVAIGDAYGGTSADFVADDARVYNRALSASEVDALYRLRSTSAPAEGQLAFNTPYSQLQYCDGTDWRMAGVGSYNPAAVFFDGTNDYLDSTTLAGIADSDKFSMSFWFNIPAGIDDISGLIYEGNTGGDTQIYIHDCFHDACNNDVHEIQARFRSDASSSNEVIMDIFSNNLNAGQWYHALLSFNSNITTGPEIHLYIDDADAERGVGLVSRADADLVEFDASQAVGGVNGDDMGIALADFWVDIGTYLDFSSAHNRRKFISDNGMPMYLGEDGSIPTGEKPEIFLSGEADNWHINLGSAGGFTENGTIVYASSQPGDRSGIAPIFTYIGELTSANISCNDDAYSQITGNTLVGAMDISGQVVTVDVSDPYNLTELDNVAVTGVRDVNVYGDYAFAVEVNGASSQIHSINISNPSSISITDSLTLANSIYIGLNDAGTVAIVTGGSLSNNIYSVDISDPANLTLLDTLDGSLSGNSNPAKVYISGDYAYIGANGPNRMFILDISDPSNLTVRGNFFSGVSNPGAAFKDDNILYVFETVSPGIARAYDVSDPDNAVQIGSTTMTNAMDHTHAFPGIMIGSDTDDYLTVVDFSDPANPSEIGYVVDASNLDKPKGISYKNNFAFVTKCNSGDSIAVWQIDGICPAGGPGYMEYNSDFNVMEYCNGVEMVAMGPIGGTPPTSGLVGHWTLNETSGTFADSSVNSNDGTQNGGVSYAETGTIGNAAGFDGVDDYINIPYNASLYGFGAMTLTGWFSVDDLDANDPKIMFADEWGTSYGIYYQSNNRLLSADIYPTAGWTYGEADMSGVITEGEWVFYAVTWEDNVQPEVYINGQNLTSWQAAAQTGTIVDNTRPLRIGWGDNAGEEFDGKLDDMRMYNRVLSPQEINQLYHFGASGGLGDVSGNCSNPSRPEGSMFYNSNHSLLQYCNGEQWIGIGN